MGNALTTKEAVITLWGKVARLEDDYYKILTENNELKSEVKQLKSNLSKTVATAGFEEFRQKIRGQTTNHDIMLKNLAAQMNNRDLSKFVTTADFEQFKQATIVQMVNQDVFLKNITTQISKRDLSKFTTTADFEKFKQETKDQINNHDVVLKNAKTLWGVKNDKLDSKIALLSAEVESNFTTTNKNIQSNALKVNEFEKKLVVTNTDLNNKIESEIDHAETSWRTKNANLDSKIMVLSAEVQSDFTAINENIKSNSLQLNNLDGRLTVSNTDLKKTLQNELQKVKGDYGSKFVQYQSKSSNEYTILSKQISGVVDEQNLAKQLFASLCRNGGIFSVRSGYFQCDCSNSNFDGQFCTIDKCEYDNPCQNNGVCSVSTGKVTCDCSNSDYGGPYCMPSICDYRNRVKYNLGTLENCKSIKDLWTQLDEKSIVSIPYLGDLKHVEKLSAWKNNIKSITSRTFENNNKLKVLVLSYNNIKELSNDSFSNLVELNRLDLQKNEIEWIGETLFRNNRKLSILNLRGNKLKTIPPNVFNNLVDLVNLYLHENQLTNVLPSVFKNKMKLNKFWLYDNNLSEENKKEIKKVYGGLIKNLRV